VPWKLHRTYSQYDNVYINPKYEPVYGDIKVLEAYRRQNKFQFYQHVEKAMGEKRYDVKVDILGSFINFHIFSLKALNEFDSFRPEKIDRSDIMKYTNGKIFPQAFDQHKSDKEWKERRQIFLKTLGINFASRFIPIIIDSIETKIATWKIGHKYEITSEIGEVSLKVIAKLLFGDGIVGNISPGLYINPNRERKQLTFFEMLPLIARDISKASVSTPFLISPTLAEYNL
jgi:hypothetical protein